MILERSHVILHHSVLGTTFKGIDHPISTPDVPIHQFRGIKYASIPARFRQSKLVTSYPSSVDATRHGYVSFSCYTYSNAKVLMQPNMSTA
jgi:carboxylesterase type B